MRAYGHDPDTLDQPLSVRTFIAPTDAEAKAEVKHVVWFYHLLATLLPGALGRPKPAGYENYPRDPAMLSQVDVEEVWQRGTCFGSPERVTELMKLYMQRTGTSHWMAQMRCGGLEHSPAVHGALCQGGNARPASGGSAGGNAPATLQTVAPPADSAATSHAVPVP